MEVLGAGNGGEIGVFEREGSGAGGGGEMESFLHSSYIVWRERGQRERKKEIRWKRG